MQVIGSNHPLVIAQAGMRRDTTRLLRTAGQSARGTLLAYAGTDGRIPERFERQVQTAVGQTISDVFTGRDNRSAFAEDGVTALAPYPRALNYWIAFATYQAVKQHTVWLRRHVPEDVYQFLRRGRRTVSEISAEGLTGMIPAQIDPLRQWVPPHRWTDERGYRLSDRIWRADMETRRKIDELLARGIRTGQASLNLSAALEAYLLPGRSGIRTLKPYGARYQPGGASFDAMRLARTEISHAFNESALISAQMNPFVDRIDVARSANGDPTCTICPQHATIGISGERIRPPYSVYSARIGPFHPHCMCHVRPVVVEDTAAVIADLRALMESGEDIYLNPADDWGFLIWLIGPVLAELLRELMAA